MADLICRKTMRRCETPGMCSPYGGCSDPSQDRLERETAALREQVARLMKDWEDLRKLKNLFECAFHESREELQRAEARAEAVEGLLSECLPLLPRPASVLRDGKWVGVETPNPGSIEQVRELQQRITAALDAAKEGSREQPR